MPGTNVDPWYADEQVVCLVWWAMDMKGGIFDQGSGIEVTFSLKKIFFFKKAYLHHPEPLCQFLLIPLWLYVLNIVFWNGFV